MRKRFENTGCSFSGMLDAIAYAKKKGYGVAEPSEGHPLGLRKGAAHIPTWPQLSDSMKASLDGRIEFDSKDRRWGAATVIING